MKDSVTRYDLQRLATFLQQRETEIYPEPLSPLHMQITLKAFEHLLELHPLPRWSKVLDVGCGQGAALRLFTERGIIPVGITLGELDLDACRGQGFVVNRMDQSFLDFDDGTFDIVWARHVLEHSLFPFYTLHEFRRVLKLGGLMYMEVPLPDTDCHHERNVNHYSVLSPSAWLSLLERNGFEVIESVSYRFTVQAGDDEYVGFYCQKAEYTEGHL
jgi:SAM-dependent methyltransferase